MTKRLNQLKELAQSFNKTIALIEVVAPFKRKDSDAWKELNNENGLFLWGSNRISQFEELVKKFLNYDNEISSSLSKQTIENRIIDLLCKSYLSKSPINQGEVEILLNDFQSILNEEWEVFRILRGAKLSSKIPLELGPYKIYSWSLHQSILMTQYSEDENCSEDENWWQSCVFTETNELLISSKATARDASKAREIADSKFRQFENIIRYMLGNKSGQVDIGIFDYHSPSISKSLSMSLTRKGGASNLQGSYVPVDLNDSYFIDPQRGHAWIWNVLQQSSLFELQKKIVAAIEWIGKGVRDTDPARSFVQFTFALEALLTFNEKGTLVSPSVASQLAEFSAFLLGKDCEERIQVEKTVKSLYSVRSAIAHGGSQSVSEEVVKEALSLVKSLIIRMTTDSELCEINSMNQLKTWVNQKKYS